MDETTLHRPKELIERFAISAAGLRIWANEFADFLSPSAQKSQTETGYSSQRRYTDDDLRVLSVVKRHLDDGHTYEEVRRRIRTEPVNDEPLPTSAPEPTSGAETRAVAPLTEEHPIMLAFRQALEAKDETIRSLEARVGEIVANKDLTIAVLHDQLTTREALIKTLGIRPLTPPPARFRWSLLTKILLEPVDTTAHGDTKP